MNGLVGLKALLSQELELVNQQAIDDLDISDIPQLVDQRSDDRDVDSRCSQLVQAVGIIETCDDVGPDSMDGVVDR